MVGNLTADPELGFTAAGIPVTGFTIPVTGFTIPFTPHVYDRDRSEFTDGEPLFLRCSLWRQAAENAAQSLTKGMRVRAASINRSVSAHPRDTPGRRIPRPVPVSNKGVQEVSACRKAGTPVSVR